MTRRELDALFDRIAKAYPDDTEVRGAVTHARRSGDLNSLHRVLGLRAEKPDDNPHYRDVHQHLIDQRV